MINTNDLSEFGFVELKEASKLLAEYIKNTSILEGGVKLEFNPSSRKVFLIDKEFNCAMINYGKDENPLEKWYNCGYCGAEGFLEDFENGFDTSSYKCKEC